MCPEAEKTGSGKHGWGPQVTPALWSFSISSMKTVMVAAYSSTQVANFSEPAPTGGYLVQASHVIASERHIVLPDC